MWDLLRNGRHAPAIELMARDALVVRGIVGVLSLSISLSASTLSAAAMELGSAAPLSIQQLDRQRYVPRPPKAPGPPIVRDMKNRVEKFGRSLPFSQKIGKTKNITGSIPNIGIVVQCRI